MGGREGRLWGIWEWELALSGVGAGRLGSYDVPGAGFAGLKDVFCEWYGFDFTIVSARVGLR